MGRYSKVHSNYVLSKPHQRIKQGEVFVRDWVTVGSQHQIEKGKKPFFSDTNFLFTDNSYVSYNKRFNNGKWVAHWDYNDVKDSKDDVNKVKVNRTSNDLRDFAYYGSAVELVNSSVTNIINTFPAKITLSDEEVRMPNDEGGYDVLDDYCYINNPFNVDFIHTLTQDEAEKVNIDRFLAHSWGKYTIQDHIPHDILSYTTTTRMFLIENNSGELGLYDYDDGLRKLESGDYRIPDCQPTIWTPTNPTPSAGEVNQGVYEVNIDGVIISAYIVNSEYVLLIKKNAVEGTFEIKPKKYVMDEYFNKLTGFEKQLLTLDSKPLYKNSFITPIGEELDYKYVKRNYTWPSEYDYDLNYAFINITSESYVSFLSDLIDLATVFDELWCDNLYKNMTHESIKNFDWTYTKDYTEGDEQDYVDGGNQIMKLLRVYGRAFDDLKREADGIGFVSQNTYDGYNNQPDAEISDRLETMGWDIVSTVPVFENENLSDVSLNDNVINQLVVGKLDGSTHSKWFDSSNSNNVNSLTNDVEFLRRLILSSSHIFRSKGTAHAIDMIMGLFGIGHSEYSLREFHYTTKPMFYSDELYKEIANINYNKYDEGKLYDDVYSGIPIKDIFIRNQHYIVPFYTQKRIYDGDIYFQCNGGWGKKIGGDSDIYNQENKEYIETVSYLHTVYDFGELLNLSPHAMNDGDIYYVTNIGSYADYVSELPDNLSSFFYISNRYQSSEPEYWINIDMTVENDEYTKKAKYLDSIVSSIFGNNPHVGYGRYDNGSEYLEYMKLPFKYSIDNHLYSENEWLQKAENITFEIGEGDYDKVKQLINDELGKITDNNNGDDAQTWPKADGDYYINSKLFKISNLVDNDFYKRYFQDVILKYLMQVIPSTSILILQGFEIDPRIIEYGGLRPKLSYPVYISAKGLETEFSSPVLECYQNVAYSDGTNGYVRLDESQFTAEYYSTGGIGNIDTTTGKVHLNNNKNLSEERRVIMNVEVRVKAIDSKDVEHEGFATADVYQSPNRIVNVGALNVIGFYYPDIDVIGTGDGAATPHLTYRQSVEYATGDIIPVTSGATVSYRGQNGFTDPFSGDITGVPANRTFNDITVEVVTATLQLNGETATATTNVIQEALKITEVSNINVNLSYDTLPAYGGGLFTPTMGCTAEVTYSDGTTGIVAVNPETKEFNLTRNPEWHGYFDLDTNLGYISHLSKSLFNTEGETTLGVITATVTSKFDIDGYEEPVIVRGSGTATIKQYPPVVTGTSNISINQFAYFDVPVTGTSILGTSPNLEFEQDVYYSNDDVLSVKYTHTLPFNEIVYKAPTQLTEVSDDPEGEVEGFHTDVFNTTMKSHTFENGVGTIVFNADVTSIGEWAFRQCTGMTDISMPNSIVTIANNAFSECSGLTNVDIPNSVESIGDDIFDECTSLNIITFLSDTPPTLSWDFGNGIDSLEHIYVPFGSIDEYKNSAASSVYIDIIEEGNDGVISDYVVETKLNGVVKEGITPPFNPTIVYSSNMGYVGRTSGIINNVPASRRTNRLPIDDVTVTIGMDDKVARETVTVYQEANIPTYEDINISEFSYPTLPGEGVPSTGYETVYPTLRYSQEVSYSDGRTETITKGAATEYRSSFEVDNNGTGSINKVGRLTGVITNVSANPTAIIRRVMNVTVTVTLNGKTKTKTVKVQQDGQRLTPILGH